MHFEKDASKSVQSCQKLPQAGTSGFSWTSPFPSRLGKCSAFGIYTCGTFISTLTFGLPKNNKLNQSRNGPFQLFFCRETKQMISVLLFRKSSFRLTKATAITKMITRHEKQTANDTFQYCHYVLSFLCVNPTTNRAAWGKHKLNEKKQGIVST